MLYIHVSIVLIVILVITSQQLRQDFAVDFCIIYSVSLCGSGFSLKSWQEQHIVIILPLCLILS